MTGNNFLKLKGLLANNMAGLTITLEDGRKFDMGQLMDEYKQYNLVDNGSTQTEGKEASDTTTKKESEGSSNPESGGGEAEDNNTGEGKNETEKT